MGLGGGVVLPSVREVLMELTLMTESNVDYQQSTLTDPYQNFLLCSLQAKLALIPQLPHFVRKVKTDKNVSTSQ